MQKNYSFVILFAIFFLFFIQMTGTLVELIYILDLMNTALDEKALGLLFFFSPILLAVPAHRKQGPLGLGRIFPAVRGPRPDPVPGYPGPYAGFWGGDWRCADPVRSPGDGQAEG